MIEGTEIVIPARGDPNALRSCARIIQCHWPGAMFESAVEAQKYADFADIPFAHIEKLLVYRDADAEAAWDADRADKPMNAKLYLYRSPQSVTVVVCDPTAVDMRRILQSIRDLLGEKTLDANLSSSLRQIRR